MGTKATPPKRSQGAQDRARDLTPGDSLLDASRPPPSEAAAEWVTITALHPWSGNPRKNDGAPVDKVAESIKRLGWGAPIVARRNGEIIAGHTRYKAAQKLGLDRVPVRYVDLDPADAKLMALADNRLNEFASWDDEKLADVFADFDTAELEVAGFSASDVDKLLSQGANDIEQDEVPEPPKEPVTKTGDVWILGDHVLMCGDSTDPEVWDRLLDGAKIQALVTDPPYGVSYVGGARAEMEGRGKRNAIANDGMKPDELQAFLTTVMGHASDRAVPGAPYYVFGPSGAELSYVFLESLRSSGWLLKHTLVWVKDAMVFGRSDFHYQHEPCWYGWKPGGAHYFGGTTKDVSTLHFDRPKKSKQHPTMKPVALIAYLAERAASPGSLVVDPFAGSGTTLIACEQLGRSARCIELDPAYCDVIVQRWETLTGGTACRRD